MSGSASPAAARNDEPGAPFLHRLAIWPTFLGLVLGAWIALYLMARSHAAPGIDLVGWRAILDPEVLAAFCLRPTPPASLGLALSMWCLMGLAMMSPVAMPMLATVSNLPASADGPARILRWWAVAAGHASVWMGFALIAALLQTALHRAGLLTAHGESVSGGLSLALLAGAGLYQFSALKGACLSRCRSPMGFLIAHWREGVSGAYRMGFRHGMDCVGCCWALMLLALVGGAMDLAWMGLAMMLMIAERLPVVGRRLSASIGVALLAGAMAVGWNSWVA